MYEDLEIITTVCPICGRKTGEAAKISGDERQTETDDFPCGECDDIDSWPF